MRRERAVTTRATLKRGPLLRRFQEAGLLSLAPFDPHTRLRCAGFESGTGFLFPFVLCRLDVQLASLLRSSRTSERGPATPARSRCSSEGAAVCRLVLPRPEVGEDSASPSVYVIGAWATATTTIIVFSIGTSMGGVL